DWMTGLLKWALAHKAITLVAAVGLLIASFMLIGKGYIGGEFIAKGDRGQFIVQLEMPKDASVEQSNQATRKVEQYLTGQPAITQLITTLWQTCEDVYGVSQSTAYKTEITVMLTDQDKREPVDIYAARKKTELNKLLPGVKVKTSSENIRGTA